MKNSGTDGFNKLLQSRPCTMAFQPIVEVSTEKIYGFEALLNGSNCAGLQSPGVLFNNEGYLDKESLLRLDTICIGSALRSGKELAKQRHLFINIHFSTLHYLSRYLDSFTCLLDELDIDPAKIVFEISEKTDLCCAIEAEIHLRELVALGIQIAIDDIGTKFDRIQRMLHAKPAYLRVDKAIIEHIDISTRKQALLKSLNLMANSMGMNLVAEGVKNHWQAQLISEIGIAFAQGPFFGHPDQAEAWMNQ